MKITIFNLLLFGLLQINLAQQVNLWGTIKDAKTGETLIGAVVVTDDHLAYATTNNYGFYSMSLKPGDYSIHYTFIGYNDSVFQVHLTASKQVNLNLNPKTIDLSEVNVFSESGGLRVRQPIIGIQQINAKTLERLPALAGEKDVLQGLQTLPGISTGNEGTTSLSVRGGSLDQNLYLLDDAPVYNPAHALSFFSVFNTEALSDVKIYTGAFPAEFGGRLSSVVDLHMREGNKQNFAGSADIGTLSSRITFEGPVIKGKASFLLSGRYCYAGTLANLAGYAIDDLKGSNIHFYDFNAKFNYQLNDKNHFYLSFYSGSDQFYSKAVDLASSMTWGNQTATFRWNHVYNSRMFANYTFIYSNYGYTNIFLNDSRNYSWLAGLSQFGAKADYYLYPAGAHKVQFGASVDYHTFNPGSIESRGDSYNIKPFHLQEKQNLQFAAYLADEWNISSRLTLYGGLRFSGMANLGKGYVLTFNESRSTVIDSTYYNSGEIINYYFSLEPRLSFSYLLNNQNSLKASYSRNTQYFNLLGNSSVGIPTDVWVPSDENIKPQHANIYCVGYFKSLANKPYEFSAEVYFKQFFNVIDFKDNANLMLNPYVEMEILTGTGRAYGLEWSAKKTMGVFTGWINYTLARNEKKISGINNGEYFHTRYDKLHNLNICLMYDLGKRWSFSGNFKLASGGYLTFPIGTYNIYGHAMNLYSDRNDFKLPMYHRLDLSVTFRSHKNENRWIKSEWLFSIYNVYNHKNIFTLYVQPAYSTGQYAKVYNMYLFGVIPTITYHLRF